MRVRFSIDKIVITFVAVSITIFLVYIFSEQSGKVADGKDNKPSVRWTKSELNPPGFNYLSPLVDRGGRLFIPFQIYQGKQGVMSIASSGKVLWEHDLHDEDRIFFSGYTLSRDNKYLYLLWRVREEVYLTCFMSDSGRVVWNIGIEGPTFVFTRLLVSKDEKIFLVTQHGVYAVNREGKVLWTYVAGAQQHKHSAFAPALSPNEETLYFLAEYDDPSTPQRDFYLCALDAGTGRFMWKSEESFQLQNYGQTFAVDSASGTVYVGAFNDFGDKLTVGKGFVYAFTSSGALKWKSDIGKTGNLQNTFPIVGRDGTLYIGSGTMPEEVEGNLPGIIALSPDGKFKWRFDISGTRFFSNGILIDKDDRLYFLFNADRRNKPKAVLYCIDKNGKYLYDIPTPGGDYWTSFPVLSPDGTIYALSGSGELFAIK